MFVGEKNARAVFSLFYDNDKIWRQSYFNSKETSWEEFDL